jgi:hypothetical protein
MMRGIVKAEKVMQKTVKGRSWKRSAKASGLVEFSDDIFSQSIFVLISSFSKKLLLQPR